MQDCIFCKIIQKQVPTEMVAENDTVIVVKDIAPKAPIHYLIIPKNHIKNVVDHDDICRAPAGALQISFRLIMNNGVDAGQTVFHLHCHFISGKHLSDF